MVFGIITFNEIDYYITYVDIFSTSFQTLLIRNCIFTPATSLLLYQALPSVCSNEAKKILEVLEHLGYKPSLNELQIVKDVCDMVSMRSARLAAAGLATIIRVSLFTDKQ